MLNRENRPNKLARAEHTKIQLISESPGRAGEGERLLLLHQTRRSGAFKGHDGCLFFLFSFSPCFSCCLLHLLCVTVTITLRDSVENDEEVYMLELWFLV